MGMRGRVGRAAFRGFGLGRGRNYHPYCRGDPGRGSDIELLEDFQHELLFQLLHIHNQQ